MNLLLDTHAAIWWWTAPDRLGPAARAAIADRGNRCHFSAASGYELAQKHRWHPDLVPTSLLDELASLVAAEDWQPLPLSLAHTLLAGRHPSPHRDPFDRLLAAQAECENLTVVTLDPAFATFSVARLW